MDPLRSAGLPYYALEPGAWDAALAAIAEIGLTHVRIDVPWRLHERASGVYEWGERRPELDLARLLVFAHARGLRVLIRPGPWLGFPLPCGGLPDRIASLVSVDGEPPFALGEPYRTAAREWLVALAQQLTPFVEPAGPVVGWVATLGSARRPGGGPLDRSPDGIAFYQRYLAARYGPGAAPGVEPPVDGPRCSADLEASIAWVEAGEVAGRAALVEQLAARPRALPRRDPSAVAVSGLAALDDTPPGSGIAAAEDAEGCWLVFPPGAESDFAALRMFGLRAAELQPLAGALAIPAATSLAHTTATFDGPTLAGVLAMCGVRSLDIDTLLPRAAAYESRGVLAAGGAPDQATARLWRQLFRLLDSVSHARLIRRSSCLLLANRETGRLREACSVGAPLPHDLASPRALGSLRVVPRSMGLRDLPEIDGDAAFEGLFDGLRRSAIPFSIADTALSRERLARERVVLVPSCERMSRPLAQRLFEWTADGGTLVLGPRLPRADWAGGPLALRLPFEVKDRLPRLRIGDLELEDADLLGGGEALLESGAGALAVAMPYGHGRLVHFGFRIPWGASAQDADSLARIASALVGGAGVAPSFPASDPEVETELHEGEERRFLFIANPGQRERSVSFGSDAREALREVRGSAVHLRPGETLGVPPRSVLVREVVKL